MIEAHYAAFIVDAMNDLAEKAVAPVLRTARNLLRPMPRSGSFAGRASF